MQKEPHSVNPSPQPGSDPTTLLSSKCVALIPAYDEAPFIAEVVRRVLGQVPACLVVDDGSHDDTPLLAENAGARLLRHPRNLGKGAAIKTALQWFIKSSTATYAVLLDGDGQHAPEEIPCFLEAAEHTGSHLLVGNRMTDTRRMPLLRRIVNRYMSWEISRVCGQRIPDSQCGFRMIHRDLAPHLLTATNAFDYETEMLFVASGLGVAIQPVTITTIYGNETSKIRPLPATIAFFKLLAQYRMRRRKSHRKTP